MPRHLCIFPLTDIGSNNDTCAAFFADDKSAPLGHYAERCAVLFPERQMIALKGLVRIISVAAS